MFFSLCKRNHILPDTLVGVLIGGFSCVGFIIEACFVDSNLLVFALPEVVNVSSAVV